MSQYVNKTSKRNPLSEIKMILKDNNATIALILAYTMVLGQFLIIPFITPYSIRNIGVSQEAIKYIYLVGGAFTLFILTESEITTCTESCLYVVFFLFLQLQTW